MLVNEALDGYFAYLKEIEDFNKSLFGKYNINTESELLDGIELTGKIKFVDAPKGKPQKSDNTKELRNIHISQQQTGTEGDNYEGTIYGQVNDDKWIAISYSC